MKTIDSYSIEYQFETMSEGERERETIYETLSRTLYQKSLSYLKPRTNAGKKKFA